MGYSYYRIHRGIGCGGDQSRRAGRAQTCGIKGGYGLHRAALALATSGIDAIMQIPGNLTAVSFTSIVRAANQAKIPIFAFQTVQADEGAVVVLAKDYFDFGKEAAFLAARVMRGENPKDIPFVGIEVSKFIINLKAAKISNLKIPEDMIKQAYNVIK